jgi:uncharacterized coiled-coil protein SlyX
MGEEFDQREVEYEGPDRRAPQGWHMKREIQLGHVLTTISLVLTGLFFITKMDQRITLLEDKVMGQRERDASQDKQLADTLSRIQAQFDHLDAKLDRLIERNTGVGK